MLSTSDPNRADMERIVALAYRRLLDRSFWYPPADTLRFEVRAVPAAEGGGYTVVAIMDGIGESWFASEDVPTRWDFLALAELSRAVMQLRREASAGEILADPDDNGSPAAPFDQLDDPTNVARFRWKVVNRLRTL